MDTKADTVNVQELLNLYREKTEQLEYNLAVEKMVVRKHQLLIEALIKKHPELKKEVMDNDGSQIKSGSKQE